MTLGSKSDPEYPKKKKSKRRKRTEILNDVLMVQTLEQFNLPLESTQHALFALLIGSRSSWQFDLLNGHEETCQSVYTEINLAERTSTDEGTLDPLDGSF